MDTRSNGRAARFNENAEQNNIQMDDDFTEDAINEKLKGYGMEDLNNILLSEKKDLLKSFNQSIEFAKLEEMSRTITNINLEENNNLEYTPEKSVLPICSPDSDEKPLRQRLPRHADLKLLGTSKQSSFPKYTIPKIIKPRDSPMPEVTSVLQKPISSRDRISRFGAKIVNTIITPLANLGMALGGENATIPNSKKEEIILDGITEIRGCTVTKVPDEDAMMNLRRNQPSKRKSPMRETTLPPIKKPVLSDAKLVLKRPKSPEPLKIPEFRIRQSQQCKRKDVWYCPDHLNPLDYTDYIMEQLDLMHEKMRKHNMTIPRARPPLPKPILGSKFTQFELDKIQETIQRQKNGYQSSDPETDDDVISLPNLRFEKEDNSRKTLLKEIQPPGRKNNVRKCYDPVETDNAAAKRLRVSERITNTVKNGPNDGWLSKSNSIYNSFIDDDDDEDFDQRPKKGKGRGQSKNKGQARGRVNGQARGQGKTRGSSKSSTQKPEYLDDFDYQAIDVLPRNLSRRSSISSTASSHTEMATDLEVISEISHSSTETRPNTLYLRTYKDQGAKNAALLEPLDLAAIEVAIDQDDDQDERTEIEACSLI